MLLSRPDTVMVPVKGGSLVLDMVSAPDRLTFPFACAEPAAAAWGCAADTIIAVPGPRLHSFRQACIGYSSQEAQCFVRVAHSHGSHAPGAAQKRQPPAFAQRRLGRRDDSVNGTDSSHGPVGRRLSGPRGVKSIGGASRPVRPRETHELDRWGADEWADGVASPEGGRRRPIARAEVVARGTAASALIATGGDNGPTPHDGRGCMSCALRLRNRHAAVDSTFFNTDYPGNDYKCIGVDSVSASLPRGRSRGCRLSCHSHRSLHRAGGLRHG